MILKQNWFKISLILLFTLIIAFIIHREYRLTLEHNYQISKYCSEMRYTEDTEDCMKEFSKYQISF